MSATWDPDQPGDPVTIGPVGWLTGGAALLFGIAALGLRWREGAWAFGRVGRGSLWLGRRIGGAAQAGTAYSSRALEESRRNRRLRRAAADGTDEAAFPGVPEPVMPDTAPIEPRPGTAMAYLSGAAFTALIMSSSVFQPVSLCT